MGDCGCSGSAKSKLNVVGKSAPEAKKFLDNAGVRYRVVQEDGESFVITMEYNPGRANLTITNGMVVDQTWG